MSMKEHILSALREQFESWEELLAGLREDQLAAPNFDLDWSIKDVIAHLWAWQQISIARMEGGIHDRKPEYPRWILDSVQDWEENANQVNDLTFEKYYLKPWSGIYGNWRKGFLHLLDAGDKISERDLLDGERYSWLHGYSLAVILIASYDHHQEHLAKLTDWLHNDA